MPHAVDAQGNQGDADDSGQELSHEGSLFRLGPQVGASDLGWRVWANGSRLVGLEAVLPARRWQA